MKHGPDLVAGGKNHEQGTGIDQVATNPWTGGAV